MMHSTEDKKLMILPVRRRLMSVTIAYLSGILTATVVVFPMKFVEIFCALLLLWAVLRLRLRKSALFCLMGILLLLGNRYAGGRLQTQDMPTASGVRIEGTVAAIEKAYRVVLTDVTIEQQPAEFAHDVVVTLMLEEEEGAALPDEPLVGQQVSGIGRLFAQDAVRNPGGVSWRVQALCEGYELSGYLLPGWSAQGEAVFSARECLRRLREVVIARVGELFGEQAALFQGIMIGDRSGLDDQVTAAMRLTGTAHILTVSGLHLSMIAGVISKLLDRIPLRRRGRCALLAVFLTFFTCLTGAAAGTVRACIMALLREYAVLRGRRYEPLTALSFAALVITLAQPLWLLNASFQFSFFVVLGIQLYSRSLTDFLNRRLHASGYRLRLLSLVAVSASAQIAAVPMQLLLYGYVPVLSLPMNILCSTIMPYLLVGGWSVTLFSVLWFGAASQLATVLALLGFAFEHLSLWVASLDGAIVRLPAPFGGSVLLILLIMLLLTSRIRLGNRRRLAAGLTACALMMTYLPRFNPAMRYVQLDVGQGDAALFRSGRRAVLMDVGPADSYDVLRYLRHEGLAVEAVILSHLDEDHAGALMTLLHSEVEIPAVITARHAVDDEVSPDVLQALEAIKAAGIALHEVSMGDRIEVNGVTLDVLSPDETLSGSNERSLVLHARAQEVSFLLTGDLPVGSEPAYVPDVDVLKVAHHGSKSSTSREFIEWAKPELALISVGADNHYGHPGERVLDDLENAGAKVLRTDLKGCITLWLKGGEYQAETYLETGASS